MLEHYDRLVDLMVEVHPEYTLDEPAAATGRVIYFKVMRLMMHRKLQDMFYTIKTMERQPSEALKAVARAKRGRWGKTKKATSGKEHPAYVLH